MRGDAKGAMKLPSAEISVLPKQFEVAIINYHVLCEGRKGKNRTITHFTGYRFPKTET